MKEYMLLADLDCGTGSYSIPTSRIVRDGIVYAVDIQREMLATLRRKIQKLSIENIRVIRSELHRLPL